MTAPSNPREALETVEDLIRRDPACFNLSDELQSVRSALRAAPSGVAERPVVSVQPMALSGGRTDYFVQIKVGDRDVTPHVFSEEYKAAYHVALYDWLLNGTEKPDLIAFGPDDWPAKVATPSRPDAGGGVWLPQGYALVPTKPTPVMIEAGCEQNPTQWNEGTDLGFAADVANDVYVAMVRVAALSTPSDAVNESAEAIESDDWRDDPSADERWNAGLDFAMQQFCAALGVDPAKVTWDAATETVDGDVQSVIWNILRTRFGENWNPDAVSAEALAEKDEGRE